jgi:hypothetical protein
MVVAESKPVQEILEMIKDCKKVVVAGCKGCVTVCNSGGEKEVGVLASELRIARKAARPAETALSVNSVACAPSPVVPSSCLTVPAGGPPGASAKWAKAP